MSLWPTFMAEAWAARLRLLMAHVDKLPKGTKEERSARALAWNDGIREAGAAQRALRRRLKETGRP